MKIFFTSLVLVIFCYHSCFGKDAPAGLYKEGDCVHGQGAITFYDGSRYVGQCKEGELHGHGIVTFADGSRYAGQFRNSEMNGQGTMTFSDGSEYVGEFKNGALCGHGIVTFPDGSVYEGQFKDDRYHGKGVWSSPFGIRYEGQFKEGRFDGQGIYSLPDGSRYIGFFKDDKFHGQGVWTLEDLSPNNSDPAQLVQRKTVHSYEADLPDAFGVVDKPEDAAAPQGEDVAFSNGMSPTGQPLGHVVPLLSREGAEVGDGPRIKEEVAAGYSIRAQTKGVSSFGTDHGEDFGGLQDKSGTDHRLHEGSKSTPDASSELSFSVQVGAFLSTKNAEKLAAILREKGYKAQLLPLNDCNNRSWYTVRLGSFLSLKEAQEKAVVFSEKEKMTTTVRPVDSL